MIHVGGFNLGLLIRQLIGVGTPRGLQGRLIAALGALFVLIRAFSQVIAPHWPRVLLLSKMLPNGKAEVLYVPKSELVRIHDQFPGGDDIAFLDEGAAIG